MSAFRSSQHPFNRLQSSRDERPASPSATEVSLKPRRTTGHGVRPIVTGPVDHGSGVYHPISCNANTGAAEEATVQLLQRPAGTFATVGAADQTNRDRTSKPLSQRRTTAVRSNGNRRHSLVTVDGREIFCCWGHLYASERTNRALRG